MNNAHRTLLILKPDGYKRNLLAAVLTHLVKHAGVRVTRIETRRLTRADIKALYGIYRAEYFYQPLCEFMMSGPSVIMELVGNHAVKQVRKCVGVGDPYPVGTIRGQLASSIKRRNVVHCSDSAKSAMVELRYFFPRDL